MLLIVGVAKSDTSLLVTRKTKMATPITLLTPKELLNSYRDSIITPVPEEPTATIKYNSEDLYNEIKRRLKKVENP